MGKLLFVDSDVLPEVYLKVVMAKQLLISGKSKGISDAVKKANISRSSYYKYKDFVFNSATQEVTNKRATIEVTLENIQGILSTVLDVLSKNKANVLTINQTIPLNNIATLTVTFDMGDMQKGIDKLLSKIKKRDHVLEVKLLGIE